MGNVAVYKKGTTDFFSQGLGLLSDVVSSNLTQTVSSTGNVEQKLEVEYPIDGYLVSELVEGAILRVSVSTDKSDYGVFEIVDTLKDDSGTITVYGDPYYNRILRMSFDNGGVFTKFSNVQSALNVAKQNITGFPADFNLASNLSTSVDLSENTYDTFGTFLEALNSAVHGNIKYSLNSIQIYSALGKDITDITLRDDMNTSSVKITTDFSGIINKVIPVLPVLDKDGNATDKTKVGTIVTSKYSYQFLDYWAGKVIQFDTQDLANTYFDRTNADRPVQTVDVDPISLDDDFSTINIFDTIELYSTRLDYTDKLRVSERVFDTLSENVTSFKLGSSSVNIFNQINEQNNEIFNNVVKLTNAAISANGKGIDYFGQAQPASPKEGDTWFWDDGTDFGIKQYTNGEWVDLASSKTAEKIAAAVDDAVAQAKSHTDEVKQGLSSDISTAKSQAASQASSALASAKSAATSQFTQAQSALSAAKTDLTNSIASEASARNAAVAAVDSQAQTYANQAKSDALNTIAKEVSDRQSAVSALDTKATNAVNQAKSDINDTIKAISVGGRNYVLNSSGLNANASAQPTLIGAISSNSRSTLSYGADGITMTNASGNTDSEWYYQIASSWQDITKTPLSDGNYMISVDVMGTASQAILRYGQKSSKSSDLAQAFTINSTTWTRISMPIIFAPNTTTFYIRINGGSNGAISGTGIFTGTETIKFRNIKIESGNKATDWTAAPEDVVLDYTTKDNQIKATITQYQTTNDGKVTKAQTDATTALGLVATKVSQTDYDQKTGDLSTKYTQVKQTADSQATDIVNIKATATSQASKINSISSDVDGTKQSISDIETTQDSQSDKINQITTDVNGTKQSITDIQTADGKQDVRMGKIETSVSGVKSDFVDYKTDANGRISTAQTTAQMAVDGLKTKVSQTDYNTKTGQLQTDLTTTTQTANQAKTDIVSIKQKDSDQDAKMNSIVSDANGTKQTVSDLQTTTGKQSGDISTLQQRADGFDATVTKINTTVNSLGQINQLMNTEFTPDFQSWTADAGFELSSTIPTYDGSDVVHIKTTSTGYDWLKQQLAVVQGQVMSFSTMMKFAPTSPDNSTVYWRYQLQWLDINKNSLGYVYGTQNFQALDWTLQKSENATAPSGAAYVSVNYYLRGAGEAWLAKPMLVFENTVGTYVQGNYNNNDALAKIKLTADQASLDLSTYKQDADGRISKAQTDITATANQVATKVSQNDYDTKTGQLTTGVSKAQQTADSVTTSLANYKTDADGRISANSADIITNANAIKQKVAQSDYDANNTKLTSRLTTVETTANGTATTVSNLQTDFNGMSYENRNLLENSGFEFPVNNITGTFSVVDGSNTTRPTPFGTKMGLIDNVASQVAKDVWGWYPLSTAFNLKANVTYTLSYYFSVAGKAGYQHSDYGVDDSGNFIKGIMAEHETPDTTGGQMVWKRYSKTFTLTTDTVLAGLRFGFVSNVDGRGWKVVDNVKLEIGSKATDHSVAPNDTTLSISQVSQKADSISKFVRDSSGNISSTFQTALSKTSIITGSTLATSIQTQTSSQITSALTDNNGKIISLINQDSSGVQIAGKNIVLNGDTTVTGAFKVSQANIANGAIGTAQIGDAAITSAKIANLDVSKITGDVTNFVKSGWNNAYGSNVTIDGTGMVVSYGNTSTSFENGNVLFKQLADYADGSNQVETIGSISTTHGGTVNNIVIGLYDQTHIPFGSTDGKKIGSPTGEIYGGDLIAFGKARDFNGNFDHIFSYSNQTASLYYGITEGFNFRDKINFNSNEIVSGSVNYNLKIGALKFSGKFDGKYVPVIVATWSGYIGGGIAFGGDNVVAFNQTQATIIS